MFVTSTATSSPGTLTFPQCAPAGMHITPSSPCRGVREQQLPTWTFAQESWTCWSSVSWPSPVHPNRTSPLYPWARNPPVTRVCRVTTGQEGNKALPEVLPQTQRALWDTAELFVLLHTGTSWRNVAVPVLLRTIRDRNPFNLFSAFPAISCGLPVQSYSLPE